MYAKGIRTPVFLTNRAQCHSHAIESPKSRQMQYAELASPPASRTSIAFSTSRSDLFAYLSNTQHAQRACTGRGCLLGGWTANAMAGFLEVFWESRYARALEILEISHDLQEKHHLFPLSRTHCVVHVVLHSSLHILHSLSRILILIPSLLSLSFPHFHRIQHNLFFSFAPYCYSYSIPFLHF